MRFSEQERTKRLLKALQQHGALENHEEGIELCYHIGDLLDAFPDFRKDFRRTVTAVERIGNKSDSANVTLGSLRASAQHMKYHIVGLSKIIERIITRLDRKARADARSTK